MSAAPRLASLESPDVFPLRTSPQNLEAEMAVLGGMVLDNAEIDEVSARLKADDFFRDVHQVLYRAIIEARGTGSAVDALILWEHLSRGPHAADFADGEIIRGILDGTPHAANTGYYATIVRQKAVSRELIAASERTIAECFANQHSAEELIEQAEARVFAIDDARATGATVDLDAALEEGDAAMRRRMLGEVTGVSTGFAALDDQLGGLPPGALVILAGRPSMGKTAVALNICEHAATHGTTPFLVSLEMGRTEVAMRMIQSRARINGYLLRNAWNLTDGDLTGIERARRELSAHSFPIDDTSTRTVGQIAANARRHKARRGIGLVVVDYLQLVSGDGQSREQEVASVSRRLKALARELQVPVIALSQLNRGVENREEKRPRMSDLRESGAIEQDADMVLFVHRPDYYDPDDKPGLAEIVIAKNRNGGTGVVELGFVKAHARFEDVQEDV